MDILKYLLIILFAVLIAKIIMTAADSVSIRFVEFFQALWKKARKSK
ncbi:hypothetical protein DCCM_2494 [Desulfocucumis palustris]|uniref:Uncharacterized protein n=1 Tax=Desulfocucumis palustris TaxID=1898651 RepID=A0A2L2XCG8_9FIRM|nr:hypothetical protein DCCM_2494 [Desulfocucumis palustris]